MENYQKLSNKIEQLIINNPQTNNKIIWLNIINAGKPEIDYLKKNYQFDIEHLKASTAKVFAQRPMLINEDAYLFLILHFPVFENEHIKAGEIEFFIGHGYLITIHNGNIPEINNFFALAKKSPTKLACYEADSSAILLAELLEQLILSCYPIIDQNSITIEKSEKIIFAAKQKQAVSLILHLRHNVIHIRKIIQNHKNILLKLANLKSSVVPGAEIQKHYSDLVDHAKRIWEMLDTQKEMVEALNSTNESLINNQMNRIMKTLTVFSVIIFPLTLLAAIFSMRTVNMPLINHPNAFWIILSFMALVSIIMMIIFSKKKWLR